MAKRKPIVEIEETLENVVEEPVVEAAPKYLLVIADRLNVRKNPSKESEVLTIVSKGDTLLANSEKITKGFFSITTADGTKGYVMKEFVEE